MSEPTNAFRVWLAENHPHIFDEFFTLNGEFAPYYGSWAAYRGRIQWRKLWHADSHG